MISDRLPSIAAKPSVSTTQRIDAEANPILANVAIARSPRRNTINDSTEQTPKIRAPYVQMSSYMIDHPFLRDSFGQQSHKHRFASGSI